MDYLLVGINTHLPEGAQILGFHNFYLNENTVRCQFLSLRCLLAIPSWDKLLFIAVLVITKYFWRIFYSVKFSNRNCLIMKCGQNSKVCPWVFFLVNEFSSMFRFNPTFNDKLNWMVNFWLPKNKKVGESNRNLFGN